MKAVYIEAQGGPEVLTYGDRPEPEAQAGGVKVRVKATALNRLDLYTPGWRPGSGPRIPATPDPGRRLRRRDCGNRRWRDHA